MGGGPLKGETVESFGKAVLSAGAGLSNRKPEEIVSTDIKPYEAGGFKLCIAQAEVTDLVQLSEYLAPLTKALDDLRDKRGLDFAMLLVTDGVRGSSRLILSSNFRSGSGSPEFLSERSNHWTKYGRWTDHIRPDAEQTHRLDFHGLG